MGSAGRSPRHAQINGQGKGRAVDGSTIEPPGEPSVARDRWLLESRAATARARHVNDMQAQGKPRSNGGVHWPVKAGPRPTCTSFCTSSIERPRHGPADCRRPRHVQSLVPVAASSETMRAKGPAFPQSLVHSMPTDSTVAWTRSGSQVQDVDRSGEHQGPGVRAMRAGCGEFEGYDSKSETRYMPLRSGAELRLHVDGTS